MDLSTPAIQSEVKTDDIKVYKQYFDKLPVKPEEAT